MVPHYVGSDVELYQLVTENVRDLIVVERYNHVTNICQVKDYFFGYILNG